MHFAYDRTPPHATHPDIVKRLKRADGHLLSVIRMIEDERSCTDIAQLLHAVEKSITQAKRTLIQDHIDHCLDAAMASAGGDGTPATVKFNAITKYLRGSFSIKAVIGASAAIGGRVRKRAIQTREGQWILTPRCPLHCVGN